LIFLNYHFNLEQIALLIGPQMSQIPEPEIRPESAGHESVDEVEASDP